MEPPTKRPNLDDVLDLSRKSNQVDNECEKYVNKKGDDDVILLSEDEDDKLLGALCEEMEKENAPKCSLKLRSRALFLKLENELRNEESTLLLLQQLRANQRSHALQTKSSRSTGTAQPPRSSHSPVAQGRAINSQVSGIKSAPGNVNRVSHPPSQNTNVPNSVAGQSAPKVTKTMAIQALEQQCNGKKAMLRKQLERTLDKVTLPKPAVGNGLSEVAFVPSTLTNEFTALIGLEEIVNTIHDFDPSAIDKTSDHARVISPFSCARCGTDFTPVWKRKRPGSSDVVCEACIVDSQRSSIHKAYSSVVSAALKQHTASEREIEHEYQEIFNSSTKLEAFIKEHERKLLVTHQAQLAQQQQQQQHQQQIHQQVANNMHNQRYHQHQSFQSQAVFNNVAGPRHAQTNTVNSANTNPMGMPNVASRRQPVSNNTAINSSPNLAASQGHAANSVVQQLASRYQQLTKAAVVGVNQNQVNHSVAASTAATANLLMAAAANPMLAAAAVSATNQQQAVAQQQAAAAALAQQRLAAVAALSGFPHQAQHSQASGSAQNSAFDQLSQFTQMQALLMNSLFCNAAASGNQGNNNTNNGSNNNTNNTNSNNNSSSNNSNRQQQQQHILQQALLQYSYLLQQHQQATAAAQAQQQQQQQHQQINAAALQQLMSGAAGNPAACMTLLQNLWALNAASNGAKK